MPDKSKVACHLCGCLFDVRGTTEPAEDDCKEIPTFYYCEKCSELTVDLKCSNCGKIFQGLPIKEKAGEPGIGCFCEECSDRMIEDMVLNQKKFSIRRQE